MTDVDAVLETAVADALQPVNYKTISQAICRAEHGIGGRCFCEKGLWRQCRATNFCGDAALAVMALLKRAKWTTSLTSPGSPR
jgi:hypothetical protein